MGSACPVTSVKGGITLSRDENKKSTLGEVNQQGMILDAQRSLLGYVSEHGFVYNSRRELLGYVSQVMSSLMRRAPIFRVRATAKTICISPSVPSSTH